MFARPIAVRNTIFRCWMTATCIPGALRLAISFLRYCCTASVGCDALVCVVIISGRTHETKLNSNHDWAGLEVTITSFAPKVRLAYKGSTHTVRPDDSASPQTSAGPRAHAALQRHHPYSTYQSNP